MAIINYAVLDETNTVVNIIAIDDNHAPPRPVNKSAKQHLREFASSIAGAPAIEIPVTQKSIDITALPTVGIGAKYDVIKDKLIPEKPYPSWIWSDAFNSWIAPIPYPEYFGEDATYFKGLPYMVDVNNIYMWDEQSKQWFLPLYNQFKIPYTDEEGRVLGQNGFVSGLIFGVNLKPQ